MSDQDALREQARSVPTEQTEGPVVAGSMLEKMARAMWERNRELCAKSGVELPAWEDDLPGLRSDWREFARAALEATREPGDEIIVAGIEGGIKENRRIRGRDPTEEIVLGDGRIPLASFTAMIAAILRGKT